MILGLITTCVGILIESVIYKKFGTSKKYNFILLGSVAIMFLFAFLYDLNNQMESIPILTPYINKIYNFIKGNIGAQIIILILIIALILICNSQNSDKLSFLQYSKIIYNFTEKAGEGSTISLIAGDMDFFGDISNSEVSVKYNIEDSPEYKQLLSKKEYIKEIRIICNNKLELNLKNAILTNTIKVKDLYHQAYKDRILNTNSIQQILRIGKISYDFSGKVQFGFYNDSNVDNQFRARFIDNRKKISGIVYHNEGIHNRINFQHLIDSVQYIVNGIKTKKLKVIGSGELKKIIKNRDLLFQRENLYSLHSLDEDEVSYYYDLMKMKWDRCNRANDNQIVEFCESFYRFYSDKETKNKMALIYVNSYKIARKKERRKEFSPFGVLYLAAVVREEGWEVGIFAIDEDNYKLDLSSYDVVGFSIVSSYSYIFLKKCCDTSKMRKDVIKIAGGYQAEKFCNQVFRDFGVDVIFKGEGEESIKDFIKNNRYSNYGDIKGIIYIGNDNAPHHTEDRGCVDLDKLPVPARDLLNPRDYIMNNRLGSEKIPMVHMLFSRGCPKNCYYCAANHDLKNNRIRYRAKEKIVEELSGLIESNQIKGFSIIDDCFLTIPDKAIEICKYITQANLNLKWSLTARVDQIDQKILNVLKESGCIEIKFGVETGSNELLKRMNKNTTVEKAKESIMLTKNNGIGVKIFIITGLPGETDITHNETINFLQEMKPYIDRISLLRYTPLAGSYIYDNPGDFGINEKVLTIENFDKMRLYRRSTNWWIERRRYDDCNKWYKEMEDFIKQNWPADK